MRPLVFLFLLLTLISQSSFGDDNVKETVSQAVATYQSALDEIDRDRRVQLFRRAEILFSQVIQERIASSPDQPFDADLYANQGNAALGAERLGPAILAYRRALDTEPNHRRAIENLEYARTLLPDWVPRPEQDTVSFGSLIDGVRLVRPSDWFGIAVVVFVLSMLVFAIYLRSGVTAWRNAGIVGCVAWIATLAWALTTASAIGERVAVVVTPEVIARSADSINAPSKFRDPLPEGTEVRVVEDRDDWIRVQLYDSREVWLPASAIVTVVGDGVAF